MIEANEIVAVALAAHKVLADHAVKNAASATSLGAALAADWVNKVVGRAIHTKDAMLLAEATEMAGIMCYVLGLPAPDNVKELATLWLADNDKGIGNEWT